ncbi:hypothetical protein AMTR_s00013p00118380 [Amborella trichopoda]|uniref:Uncharacterized protein n=1 Tax=Amborella trichopoda TaxID=13333 RepID=W1PQ84_AMBTC|nr:hypothetical protein AMTR_s00013p00118380 [Amborella trichopoda]
MQLPCKNWREFGNRRTKRGSLMGFAPFERNNNGMGWEKYKVKGLGSCQSACPLLRLGMSSGRASKERPKSNTWPTGQTCALLCVVGSGPSSGNRARLICGLS